MTIKTRPVLIFLLFFLLLMQCHSCAQQSNNSLLTYHWVMSKNHPFLKSKIDSTIVPSILLETIDEKTRICGFSKPLFQEKGFRSKVLIKINYKIENGSELYLKLIIIGDCEKIISIDTFYFSLNEEWTTETLSVDLMETAFLNLSIEAKKDTKNMIEIGRASCRERV